MKTKRCGIILAAGEGKRLKPFVKRWTGSHLPKQYVKLDESGSMLEKTFQRVDRVIPKERVFTVVDQKHFFYSEARSQLRGRTGGTVISQPQNKETAAGLLLPLVHLLKRYPKANVAVFPSDHYIKENDLFAAYLDQAFSFVEHDASRILLLGVQPSGPEEEYGYILPGTPVMRNNILAYNVEAFIEKPEKKIARECIQRDGLWNSMIMVCKAQTLFGLILEALPSLAAFFLSIYEHIGEPYEKKMTERLYQNLQTLNFSSDFLHRTTSRCPSLLAVLPAFDLTWTDLGSEKRILSILKPEEQLQAC